MSPSPLGAQPLDPCASPRASRVALYCRQRRREHTLGSASRARLLSCARRALLLFASPSTTSSRTGVAHQWSRPSELSIQTGRPPPARANRSPVRTDDVAVERGCPSSRSRCTSPPGRGTPSHLEHRQRLAAQVPPWIVSTSPLGVPAEHDAHARHPRFDESRGGTRRGRPRRRGAAEATAERRG